MGRSAFFNFNPWLLDGGNDGQRYPVMEGDYQLPPPSGFEWSANFDNSDDRWLAHSQKNYDFPNQNGRKGTQATYSIQLTRIMPLIKVKSERKRFVTIIIIGRYL